VNAETLQGSSSGGEGLARPVTLTCTSEECQILQMALGELLGSVQRQEHLVPTIRTLIKRLKDAELSGNEGRVSTQA